MMEETDRGHSGRSRWRFAFAELGAYGSTRPEHDSKSAWFQLFEALSFQLSLAVLFFSSAILTGYYFGIEYLYRPIAGGPATHPFTAILCLLLSMALLSPLENTRYLVARKTLIFTVLSIVLFSLADYIFKSNLLPGTFFFGETLHIELGTGLSNYLSINTDIMLLLIAGSVLAEVYGKHLISQLFAFFAIGIPCISFIGYIYGISSFHSHMSMYTALLGFMLGWSALARTSGEAGFKAVLSPYIGGKVARIQVITGMFLPFLLGLFLIPYTDQLNLVLISIFVILLTWVLVLMTSISAIVQEEIESIRQKTTDELIKAASTDSLTGLLNRRQFIDLTETEYKKAVRSRRNLALLMIDVDDFKLINDEAGHAVGDAALIRIAQAISSSVRDTDLVCRFGGEEFTLLLFDSSQRGVTRVCNKILSSVAAVEIDKWTDRFGPVTVSIGASLLSEKTDFERCLKMADQAMYKSKQRGKNQAVYLH